MSHHIPVTHADLQAYVDGQLGAERQREVESYLQQNPDTSTMVEDLLRINKEIHKAYDPVLDEPLPEQLVIRQRKPSAGLLDVAAAICWMMLGGVIGWQFSSMMVTTAPADTLTAHLVKPAAFAHVVYTPEVRHPVEVSGDEQEHMVKWLSKRLKTTLRIPDLRSHGFELVGGRLLPSTDRMAAQFMYQREDGVRITLYNRHGGWGDEQTSFQYTKQNNTAVFYWIDGPLGFALVGNLDKLELFKLSETVYQQLN